MFAVEIFERQVRSGSTWIPAAPALSPSGFYSDIDGLFPLSELIAASDAGPQCGLLPESTGWRWASSERVQSYAAEVGARVVSREGWLAALPTDAKYGSDGFQYTFDWGDDEWQAERVVGFVLTSSSNVRRRRWLRPVVAEPRLQQFLQRWCSCSCLPDGRAVVREASEGSEQAGGSLLPLVKLHASRHVLIATHGVGAPTDESLGMKMQGMRSGLLALARSGYEVGACGVDFEYVIWSNRSPRLAQVTAWLSRLHVPTHPVIRETSKKTVLQAALYMGGFREDIQAALLEELNHSYAMYLATHPHFNERDEAIDALMRCSCSLSRGCALSETLAAGAGAGAATTDGRLYAADGAESALVVHAQGAGAESEPSGLCAAHLRSSHVSLFCHSLGGVIALDLTLQRPYPLLFTPLHLFAMGSPIGLYLSLRGLRKCELEVFLRRLYLGPAWHEDDEEDAAGGVDSGAAGLLPEAASLVRAPESFFASPTASLPFASGAPSAPGVTGVPATQLHNVYDSQDAVAYLIAPLLWNEAADGSLPPPQSVPHSGSSSTRGEFNRAFRDLCEMERLLAACSLPAALGAADKAPLPLHVRADSAGTASTSSAGGSFLADTPSGAGAMPPRPRPGGTSLGIGPAPGTPLPRPSALAAAPLSPFAPSPFAGRVRAASAALSVRDGTGPSPLARLYARGLDLPLPHDTAATGSDNPITAFAAAGAAGMGHDVKTGIPAGFPGGPSAGATTSSAAAAGTAGDSGAADEDGSSGGGGGALIGGFSTLSAVGEYVSAMNAHRVYWTSPHVLAYIVSQVLRRERDVLAARMRGGLRTSPGGGDGARP